MKNLDDSDQEELDFLWSLCDADHDNVIDGEDFFHVCDILVCTVKATKFDRAHVVPSPWDAGFGNIDKKKIEAFNEGRVWRSLFSRFLKGGLFPQLRVILVLRYFQ